MAISITVQPSSCAIPTGKTAIFSIAVDGEVASYQWEWKKTKSATEWKNSSIAPGTTATLYFGVTASLDGYIYRCKITGADGSVIYSDEVELIVIDVRNQRALVSMTTLSDIADAIRAKTETTDCILPADMAALISSINSGEIMMGFNIMGTGTMSSYSLGVSLPQYDRYCLVIMPMCSSNYGGIIMIIDNIECNYCITPNGSYSGRWIIDFENGTITNQHFVPSQGETFMWAYFEVEL